MRSHLAAPFRCRTSSKCCWSGADPPCRSLCIPQVRAEPALGGASTSLRDWLGQHQSAAGLRKPPLQERLKILIQHSQVRSYLSAESLGRYREAERRHRLDPANNKQSPPMAHLYEADLDCILRLLRCPGCFCLAAACARLCLDCIHGFRRHPLPAQVPRMLLRDICCVCCAGGCCMGAYALDCVLLQPVIAQVPCSILP